MKTNCEKGTFSDITLEAVSEKLYSTSKNEELLSSLQFKNKFTVIKQLFKSPNSSVFLANFKKQGALKVVVGQLQTKLLEKEYRTLKLIDHPHIIKPISCENGINEKGDAISYLFCPFYKNGEMFDYIKS